MATYTKTTDFLAKDSLPLNNAAKYVKGSEIDTEFNNIATADADNLKISALGTSVETALGVAIGSSGAPVLFNGALGTPSSGTLTNATGLPAAGVVGTAAILGANTFTAIQRWAKGADVASAGALTLGTDGNYFDITGTTPITSIGTLGVGTVVKLHFDGILTFTHHATDLILPGAANITTAAGDEAELVEYATGDWRCTGYMKADTSIVLSNTTLNVPSAYATIASAMVYLSDKQFSPDSVITIQVADGTHDYTGASVSLNHPQGSQIQILGNTTTPTNCVLTWTNTATGIDGLYVSDGNTLGLLNGFHITRTAHANTAISGGIIADNNATIILGNKMKVSNWYYGIAARIGSYIDAPSAIVDAAGDVGIWAYMGSTVDCQSATVTNTADSVNNLGFGIQAEYGSAVDCQSASSTGNRIAGIAALSGSSVKANSATASSNSRSGFYARDAGTIECHSATNSSNTTYGIEEITNGSVYYTSITQSGNGTDRAPVAVLNADGTLGARVSSTSGDLRLDTEGASSVYFNTSGGAQLGIGHTASAVNHPKVTGAAAGGAVLYFAEGTDTNISTHLRGKGAGSIFLGSNQANFARVNGATAGNQPAIYAEGSDTNIDLLLSGKGTGVVCFGAHTGGGDTVSDGYITVKDAAGNTRKLMTTA